MKKLTLLRVYLGTYDANDLSKFFSRITNYQIKIVNRGNFIANAYFDIDHNKWNLADSTEAFNKAINTCRRENAVIKLSTIKQRNLNQYYKLLEIYDGLKRKHREEA